MDYLSICVDNIYENNYVSKVIEALSNITYSNDGLTLEQYANTQIEFYKKLFIKIIQDSKLSEEDKIITERILDIIMQPIYDNIRSKLWSLKTLNADKKLNL